MKKTVCFIGATILLILTTAFCVAGTVQSQSNKEIQLCENFYRQLEDGYVDELRTYLTQEGYINCGIMLTRTVYEDGTREYQVLLHHNRFEKLNDTEVCALKEAVEEKAFAAEGCSFYCLIKGNA